MPRFVKNSPYLPWSLANASRQFAIRARSSVLRSYRLLEQAQGAWNRLDIRAAEEVLAALRAYLRPADPRASGDDKRHPHHCSRASAVGLRRVTTSARQGQGGVIDWFGTNSVQAEADRRKQYGKLARITEMRAEAGAHVLFECV